MPEKKRSKFRQLLTGILVLALPFLLLVNSKEQEVYICLGPQSHSYHKTKACRGLTRCSKGPIPVPLSTAIKKYNRDSCDFCYK